MTDEIRLTEEKETLFITLYAKALDNRSKYSILHDQAADDLLRTVAYDFAKHKSFGSNVMVIRAKQMDEWIKEFIGVNKSAVVVYLGCGLDTRVSRINPGPAISWFDVDYPEVIRLRKTFYADREGYRMIGSSVTGPDWLGHIPHNRPAMIIAEGLLEYLTAEEVKTLLNRLTDYFSHGQIIFDVMSSFAIQSGKEKLRDTTGAVHKWAVDDAGAVDALNDKLKRIVALPLFKIRYIRRLSPGFRMLYGLMSLIPRYNNMIRLMRYQF